MRLTYLGAIDAQVNWGSNTDPRGLLVEGMEYEVEKVEVHSWHTKVYLKGIDGKFNSSHFSPFELTEEHLKDFWERKKGFRV